MRPKLLKPDVKTLTKDEFLAGRTFYNYFDSSLHCHYVKADNHIVYDSLHDSNDKHICLVPRDKITEVGFEFSINIFNNSLIGQVFFNECILTNEKV